jgi:hypothetical protein
MASTSTRTFATPANAGAVRTRALGVAGAVIAAVAVWVVEVPILGLHLNIRFGSGAAQTIGIGFVVGATFFASLLGWGLLAMLERRTARALPIWTAVAVVVLLVSLSLPLIAGIATSTKVALVAMHLAAAAVLIPILRSGSSASRA